MPYLSAGDLKARLPDLVAAPDAALDELVAGFESLAERYRGVAFTPRTTIETVTAGAMSPWLRLSWPLVRSIDSADVVGGDSIDLADIFADVDGVGWSQRGRWWPCGQRVTVSYSHGYSEPPPTILRACRLYVQREWLSERAPNTGNTYMSFNADMGIVERASTADWASDRPTGWLDVDKLLNEVPDYRIPGIA